MKRKTTNLLSPGFEFLGRGLAKTPDGFFVQVCFECSKTTLTDWLLFAEFVAHWGCFDCRMKEAS